MNPALMIASTVRRFATILLLGALFLMQAAAQSRISLHIERGLDFNGNLLKFPDGTFIVERYGELYRLAADGQFERKLPFDPAHPVPEVTAYNTYFRELLAPLADGGFFAVLDFDIPFLGSVRQRLGRFDRDGRLVSAVDRSYDPIGIGLQLPDGSVLFGSSSPDDDFHHCALSSLKPDNDGLGCVPIIALGSTLVQGSTRAIAIQGSNVIAAGSFSISQQGTITGKAALLRLNADLLLDSSFQPPLCKDVSQLAVQSDGRIIARGRLADAQGVFETETSVFRLNADGGFERRFLQTSPDEWQTPAFGIEPNGEIIILNSPDGETIPKYPKLWRYHPDGTLKETITMQYPCCGGYGFDKIEFLADGSFLAHFLDNNAGPSGRYPHHWVGFKPDGQLHPSFPPSPFDYVNVYLSITNLIPNRESYVEESKDLLLWERQGPSNNWGDVESIEKFHVKGPLRMAEDPGPHFFRVVQ